MGAQQQARGGLRERIDGAAALARFSAEIDVRDGYTAGHSMRVRTLALAIGEQLELEGDDLETLGHAALFHDVGKYAIPDSVLLKPTRLTREEWAIMRTHSLEGARIAAANGLPALVVDAIRHHHERFDGSGYPDGLAGQAIPIAARIIHVADAVDSMITTRVYRTAARFDEALAEVHASAGSQFCPRCAVGLAAASSRPSDRRGKRRLGSLSPRA